MNAFLSGFIKRAQEHGWSEMMAKKAFSNMRGMGQPSAGMQYLQQQSMNTAQQYRPQITPGMVSGRNSGGVVTNTGQSNFNYRGMRNINAAGSQYNPGGGQVQEYNPQHDMMNTTVTGQAAQQLGGPGAASARTVAPQYAGSSPIASMTYGQRRMGGPSIIDEHGPVNMQRMQQQASMMR